MMALSTEYNCHIMNVLHTNPNSDKARGHIGSTLQRKVLTTKLVDSCDMNRAYARVKISRAIANGLLYERGGVLYLP